MHKNCHCYGDNRVPAKEFDFLIDQRSSRLRTIDSSCVITTSKQSHRCSSSTNTQIEIVTTAIR